MGLNKCIWAGLTSACFGYRIVFISSQVKQTQYSWFLLKVFLNANVSKKNQKTLFLLFTSIYLVTHFRSPMFGKDCLIGSGAWPAGMQSSTVFSVTANENCSFSRGGENEARWREGEYIYIYIYIYIFMRTIREVDKDRNEWPAPERENKEMSEEFVGWWTYSKAGEGTKWGLRRKREV